jgi:hypothetical protein
MRSSRAKPPPEADEDGSGTELSRSTLGHSRSKSSGKGKGKGHIEVIEEADEDDIARAVPPTKRLVKGKENVAHDAKLPRPTRHTKTFRVDDTEEEAHQPKRRPPKKGRAAPDEREESSPDVDSESDVRPAGKKQNRGVERVPSREVSLEDMKPKKIQAPMKKVKGRARINLLESEDDRIDETEGLPHPVRKTTSKAPAQRRAKPRAIEDGNEGSDDEPEEVEQTERSLPSLDRSKDKAQSTILESTETAPSWSGDEVVIPVPALVKNAGRVVNGKGPKSTGVTASQRERYRSRTTSDSSNSSKPLVSEGEASTTPSTPHDVQIDMVDIDLDAASAPATPSRKRGESNIHSGSEAVRGMDDRALASPAGTFRSPECPEQRTLQHEEDPVTPPPPSSSLLSVSSTTSTTKVEGHTDTETLVEPLPVRANGVQLTEEERMMTVEQWIRQEIEVQYERLKRDGETKIRLFKERAEAVRRQVEAL